MKYIKMQIGHQFKLVKHQMEHVFQIIMDHQQDNVFKVEQMVFGVQLLQLLAIVQLSLSLFLSIFFFISME